MIQMRERKRGSEDHVTLELMFFIIYFMHQGAPFHTIREDR